METVEKSYESAEKIEFLLNAAIADHLDGCSRELELIINLIYDINNANKNELEKIVYSDK